MGSEASGVQTSSTGGASYLSEDLGMCVAPEGETTSVSTPTDPPIPPDPSQTSFCSSSQPFPLYTPSFQSVSPLLSFFEGSCQDVTQPEVARVAIAQKLEQIRGLIVVGRISEARSLLAEAKEEIRIFLRENPEAKRDPEVLRLAATWRFFRGQVLDRSGNEEGHRQAVEEYSKAKNLLTRVLNQNPQDPEAFLLRAQAHHYLADYATAVADYEMAASLSSNAIPQLEAYRCELQRLGQSYLTQRQAAEIVNDLPRATLFLTEEIKVAEALGDTSRVASLSERLAAASKAQALDTLIGQIEEMAREGLLSPENLTAYEAHVAFATGGEGAPEIRFTPAFEVLSDPEKLAVLRGIQMAGLIAQNRRASGGESDPIKKLYYESRALLLEGRMEEAELAMREFKGETQWLDDPNLPQEDKHPELVMMREEVRRNLQTLTLSRINKLLEWSQTFTDQRGRGIFSSQSMEEHAGGVRERFLLGLRHVVSQGRADTLEEAVEYLRGEPNQLRAAFLRNGGVIQKDWIVDLPSLYQRPRWGSPEMTAEREAASQFFAAFRQDPSTASHPNVMTFRLEGGTLNVWGSHLPQATKIIIGKEGGTINIGEYSYVFPPTDHEVVVALGSTLVAPHLSAWDGDYSQRVNTFGRGEMGKTRFDLEGGHPQSLDGIFGPYRTVFDDEDFARLFAMGTEAGLQRMSTPEGKRAYLLEVAQGLRHRSGSYAVTAEILEGLFAGELQQALAEIPQSEIDRIRTEAEADRAEVREKVREELEELKEKNPSLYAQRFPSGEPTTAQVEELVNQALEGKAAIQIRKLAFARIDARHEQGRIDDPIAAQAWALYEDMKDPLDRTWNLADETWDSIVDEVVITAVTLPITMGVGSAVRVGLSGTSLALRFAAQGGWRALAARGLIFTAGSVAEGFTMEATKTAFFGMPFELRNVGFNIVMFGSFHGGGRLWGKAASRLGVGEEAVRTATGLARYGRMSANFTGTMATQTAVATTLGEAELLLSDHGSPYTFWERLGGHALRMVAFHYGTKAINLATGNLAIEAEGRAQLRMRVAQESGKRGVSVDQAVFFAREIVPPVTSESPGEARFVPISQVRQWAEMRSQYDPQSATFYALTQRIRGAVVTDTPLTGPGLEDLRVVDHHGPYATPDGKNATMKLLDMMEAALQRVGGNVQKAIQELNVRQVTTDNLADGGWTVWIARNQARVLGDPALREMIRQATHFEDFTAFGSAYNRGDPAVELQAAIFNRYNEILRNNGIAGSDRFPPDKAAKVMTEALAAIDEIVGNPVARRAAAEELWTQVDAATEAARGTVIPEASPDGQVVFFDLGGLSQFPIFTQWLAIPQAHALNLQATVAPMPPAAVNGTSVPRTLTIVAIPNGRSLPSGKGLLSVVEAVNAAEAARAGELEIEPTVWFGKDNVILPNPAKGGTLLTPAEISAILRSSGNGLFPQQPSVPSTTQSVAVSEGPRVIPIEGRRQDGLGVGRTAPVALEPLPPFDTTLLPPERAYDVTVWLEGRELGSLARGEQIDLVRHLTLEREWGRSDLQALIGPEGMREVLGYGREIPFGFESETQFHQFQSVLFGELLSAGLPLEGEGVRIAVHGSAVRVGNTEGVPYRWNVQVGPDGSPVPASDIDIAIVVSPELYERYVEARRSEHRAERSLPDGTVVRTKAARRFERILGQGRLDFFHLPHEYFQAINRVRDQLRASGFERGIQVSLMPEGSSFIPAPEEMMFLSADGTFGP